jgi:hypothetical protein
MYLTEDAYMRTFGELAARPPSSEVVFDFPVSPKALGPLRRAAAEDLATRLAALGEPILGRIDPATLPARASRVTSDSCKPSDRPSK